MSGHVSGKWESRHDWSQLGYVSANAYKRTFPTTGHELQSQTSLLHLSDSHLAASLTKTGENSSDSQSLTGFPRVKDITIELGADAVFNTGDLFHNDRHGTPRTVKEAAQEQLARLAERDILFYSIDGDHERDASREVFREFERDGLVM